MASGDGSSGRHFRGPRALVVVALGILAEPLGWNTLVGALTLIVGTALAAGSNRAALLRRPTAAT